MAETIENISQGEAYKDLAGQRPVVGGGPGAYVPLPWDKYRNDYDPRYTASDQRPVLGRNLTDKSVPSSTDNSARIGDYVIRYGIPEVVPNSKTDINLKYYGITGGAEKFTSPISGWEPVALMGGSLVGAVAAGAKNPISAPVALGIATIGGVYESQKMLDQHQKALQAWRDQRVTLQKYATFNDDGTYSVDLSGAGGLDSRSGKGALDAQNIETNVELGDDNRLKITVAPGFASTKTYRNIVDEVSKSYGGLTKDHAQYQEIIDNIKQRIDSYKNQFEYEKHEYGVFKNLYPNASDENIIIAYRTQLGGYLPNEEQMENYQVIVLRDGEKVVETAKDVLDDFYNLSKEDKSSYMLDMYATLSSPDVPDDVKVLTQAEVWMLNAASTNNNATDENGKTTKLKYYGMLDRGIIETFLTEFRGIFGNSLASTINFFSFGNWWKSDLEGLKPNEVVKGFALFTGTATNVYLTNYIQNTLIEGKVIRNIPFVKNFIRWTPNSPLAASVKEAGTDFAINVVSDSIYDVAQTGIAIMSGREDDFAEKYISNLQQDIFMDVVLTGISSVQMQSSLARRPTGTDYADYNSSAINDAVLKNGSMYGDEMKIRDLAYEPDGSGGGQKLANTDEVGSKIAKKLGKLEENKAVGKFRELFFDKNEAITAESMKAYGATQDRNLYLRGIESSQDIRKLTGYEIDKINSDFYVDGVNKSWLELTSSVFEFSPSGKFKKSEIAYMVASEELARYREVFKGDAKNLRIVEDFYRPYINAISAQKAAQLDNISVKLKDWLTKVGDSYIKSGVGNKEALANMRDGDVFNKTGWMPLWGKTVSKKSLFKQLSLSDQIRKTSKEWVDIEKLYSPEEFENPINAGMKWASNIANNIAVNERNKDIIRLADAAGDIRKTMSAPSAKIDDIIENIDIIKQRYDDVSASTKERIRKQVPTQDEYRATHERIISKSKFDRAVSDYTTTKTRESFDSLYDKLKGNGIVEGTTSRGQQYKVSSHITRHILSDGSFVRGKSVTTSPLAEYAILNANLDYSTPSRSNPNNYVDFVDAYGITHQIIYGRSGDDGRTTIVSVYPVGDIDNLSIMRANQVLMKNSDVINAIRRTSELGLNLNKIQNEASEIIRKAEKNNKKFRNEGFVDVDEYINGTLVHKLAMAARSDDPVSSMNKVIVDSMEEVNPYVSYEQVLASASDQDVADLSNWIKKNAKFRSGVDNVEKDKAITEVIASLGKESSDNYTSGLAVKTIEDKNGGIVTYYDENNIKRSFFIEGEIGRRLSRLANDPNTFVERGVLDQALRRFANMKRLLTTGIDPTRALPNFSRDIVRGYITSGGDMIFDPMTLLKDLMAAEGFSSTEINKIESSLNLTLRRVSGETLNASLETANRFKGKELSRAAVESTEPKAVRYIWDLKYDKKGLLKKPTDFFEGLTRKKLAKSAYTRSLYQTAGSGMTLDQRLDAAMREARVAGTEFTTNFSRKGRIIESVSGYVPYFAQNFSNLESFKLAFVADPVGVGSRLSGFMFAYIYLLSDTLSNENSRKNYYNLTEYDRANNIIISVDDGTIITIPLDESLAGFIFPYRRLIETWSNVDRASFMEIIVGGLLELGPLDLSGFTEGDGFNLQRGFERLGAQMLPTGITGIGQVATGRNWYYGSDIAVTDEQLAQYGNYAPTPGEYTTASKNSKILAEIANKTGIPQWQLQSLIEQYTGNVGQYVVNSLDKLSGASEDEQGGKEFVDSIFKSFTGMDSRNAENAFYNGIQQLKKEKGELLNELSQINEQLAAATGQDKVDLHNKYQQKKNEYAVKVTDFVETYLSAYEITGGLSRQQAMQIYWLFRLDDDRSVYEEGTPGDYYIGQAKQQASNDATKQAAPILDKYYNQTRNLYQDANGEWKVYAPYGEKAYYNTIYGEGVSHEVALRNLLEGKNNSLKDERSAMYAKRNAAYAAKDWGTYERVALEFDQKVIDTIAPYINSRGAENVLSHSTVLDYLEEWIVVPSKWMTSKYGKNVSLGHNASKQRAYVRPYIKYLFGLDTDYSNYNDTERTNRSPLEY